MAGRRYPAMGLGRVGVIRALGRLLACALDATLLVDLPLTAGIGMAGMVFVGGVLNLAHIATTSVLIALVVALVALAALVGFRSRRRLATDGPATVDRNGRVAAAAAMGLFFAVMSLRYFLSLGHPLSLWDDDPYYLAQIVKLLQTGTLGVDPYCFRQMSSMNGQTFLVALGCCAVPLEYAFVVDPGMCLVVLGGLIYTFSRRDLGQSIVVAGLFGTTSLLIRTYMPDNNLGGEFSGPVLFVTAVRLMLTGNAESATLPFGRLVLAALALASMAVLKSTFTVYAGLFLTCWCLLTLWSRGPTTIVRQALPLALFCAVRVTVDDPAIPVVRDAVLPRPWKGLLLHEPWDRGGTPRRYARDQVEGCVCVAVAGLFHSLARLAERVVGDFRQVTGSVLPERSVYVVERGSWVLPDRFLTPDLRR